MSTSNLMRSGYGPAERGVSEMMVNLYKTFAAPHSHDILFEWHRMLMSGRQDPNDIGRYRPSSEPMPVLSGAMGSPKIHFEAPPSAKVPAEMKQFITWFNRTAPGSAEPLPALTRAGAAHLYFESIHPFEDGNGRIGRALAEKSLAQSLGQPSLIALAATILARRALLCGARSGEQKQRNHRMAGLVCRHDNRSAAAHPCACRIPHRQDKVARPHPRRAQREAGKSAPSDVQGAAGRIRGRHECWQVQHHHRRVSCHNHA